MYLDRNLRVKMSKFESLLYRRSLQAAGAVHTVLDCDPRALNLARSPQYLSQGALWYAPCFLLICLHFSLVCSTGFPAHPRH